MEGIQAFPGILSCVYLCMMVGISSAISYVQVCYDEWTMKNDTCFYFQDPAKKSFQDAIDFCQSFGPYARLFTPNEPADILQIEQNIRQFTSLDVTNKVLIHTGIRNIVDETEASGIHWEWGTGDPIKAPWWCGTQPDNPGGPQVAVVNAMMTPLCLHDVGESYGASFICDEVKTFCPENFKLFRDRCFGGDGTQLTFAQAKQECEKLPGGHLAAFRDQEEFDFLKDIEFARASWIGLILPAGSSTWEFTDGSTMPNIDDFGVNDPCGGINNFGNLMSRSCSKAKSYVCMVEAQFGMALVDASLGNDYINLFDMRTETCVEARQTLMTVERPYLELLIPRVQDTAALTVYFNQTIDCQQRKVIFSMTSMNYSACSNQRYLKSCILEPGGNDVTSCSYRCPCDGTECPVMLIDEFEQYQNQPADICEIDLTRNVTL